jgi:hypothetical protein
MKKLTVLIDESEYKQYGFESGSIDFFTFKNLVLEKNNQKIYKLSKDQKKAISVSKEAVKKGKTSTNKVVFDKINKWLGK